MTATIEITGDDRGNGVNGTYVRLSCEQTVVHSALWRRDGAGKRPSLYIYLRPDVIRAGLDVAVISPTPSYEDGMEICELNDWIPENAYVEKTHNTKVTFLNWEPVPNQLHVEAPTPAIQMKTLSKTFHESVSCSKEDGSSNLPLCEMTGLSPEVIQVLLENTEEGDNDLDLFGKFGKRNARHLSIVAESTLLKNAAKGNLSLELSKWYKLPHSTSFGASETHVPPAPEPIWQTKSGRKGYIHERVYDEEESIEYHRVSGKVLRAILQYVILLEKRLERRLFHHSF